MPRGLAVSFGTTTEGVLAWLVSFAKGKGPGTVGSLDRAHELPSRATGQPLFSWQAWLRAHEAAVTATSRLPLSQLASFGDSFLQERWRRAPLASFCLQIQPRLLS